MAEASRLKLHEELCELLGSRHAYFQPPESIKLIYPCIVYARSNVSIRRADNRLYTGMDEYEITHIGPDPDCPFHDEILNHFEMCSFDRSFTADNMNHNVYHIYY